MIRPAMALLCAVFIIVALAAAPAAADKSGGINLALMSRLETHTNIYDGVSDFSGETFVYHMISGYGKLTDRLLGSMYYINKYSLDDSEFASHIGGLSLIHPFNRKTIGVLGYSHTSNPSRGVTIVRPSTDRDRFNTAIIYNFTMYDEILTQYTSTTSFSTVTDFGAQQALSQKFEAKFPDVMDRTSGALGYTYVYSFKETEQLTNQLSGKLSYSLNEKTKLTFGMLFIDNTYTNNQGDDTVMRVSLNYSL